MKVMQETKMPLHDLMVVTKMALDAVKFLSNEKRGGRDNSS